MLWVFLFLAGYPYVVYPVLVRLLAVIRARPPHRAVFEPTVTVVIAAYNEADVIEQTVLNKLAQQYPEDKLDVIVVSDGSDDETDQIVNRLAVPGSRVRLIRQEPRQGKTAALNRAVSTADSDIIVFSDANSRYAADAIARLMQPLADNRVGYVTGQMTYTDATGAPAEDGGSAYMRYENSLRRYESRIGSVVGVDGGIDAVRRSLYVPMNPDQLPDFVLPLNIVESGYRVVYEPDAILFEESLASGLSEYRMRVRVALRALWAIWDKRGLLNPVRFPLFSWQLASHKLLRYLGVFPLLLTFGVALAGAGDKASHLLVTMVFCIGGIAALLGFMDRFRSNKLFRFLHFFLLLNLSNLVACVRFLKGEKIVVWRPRLG